MRVRLVNPHSYVYFDSIDENGDVVNLRCAVQSGRCLVNIAFWSKMGLIVIARTAAVPLVFYRCIAAIGSCWTSRAWTPNKSRAGHSR